MKKSKLLLSLTMMCLSIAVLCFGVLAATSVTYSISGTISYTVTDVFVKINTSVYGIAEQQSKADVITTVKAMENVSQANSLTINSKTYTRTQTMVEYDSSSATTDPVTHTAQTSDSKGVEIVYGTYYTYYIVINIQNLSSSKTVDAIITDNTTTEINSIKTTNLYLNDVEYGTPKNIVIAYSIKDKTQGIDSTTAEIKYSLKVSYENDDYTSGKTITKETVNSVEGYYITLGKTSSDVTTEDVKWRLVSLDGMSSYNYGETGTNDKLDESDNVRYLSDAVFVQETALNTNKEWWNTPDNIDKEYLDEGNLIRNNIRSGKWYQIDEDSEYIKQGYIKAREISTVSSVYIDKIGKSVTYPYAVSGGTNTSKDYFWIMSIDEICTFFNEPLKTSFEEYNYMRSRAIWSAGSYWLREIVYVYNNYGGDVSAHRYAVMIDGNGSLSYAHELNNECYRAAFQLA